MSAISVYDLKDKLGLTENGDSEQRHEFLMKHILQLETEIAGLKTQLDEERIQFSGYVDQISRLNVTREELILEYESRERELQQDMFSLRQQLNSYRNSETRDMLMNQGMIDIADSTPAQQVAHLLIDRARLMDVIEELKERIVNHSINQSTSISNPEFEGRFVNLETTKSASNIEELLSKVQHLEVNNNLLLEKLMTVFPQGFNEINENDDNKTKTENLTENFKTPTTMGEAVKRLKVAEVKVQKVERLENEVRIKEEEIKKLKVQLDLLLNHNKSLKDLPDDVSCSRDEQNSSELLLKHGDKIESMLKSVEEQLKNMKVVSDQNKSDNEATFSIKQLQVLQKEFELLKIELIKMITKYDNHTIKYRDHKLNSKNKLFKLREAFKKEKQEFMERVEELKNRLELNTEVMSRDVDYKNNLEKTVQSLINEQRSFMNQISQQDETILKQKREINKLTSKNEKQFQIEISSDKNVSITRTSEQAL